MMEKADSNRAAWRWDLLSPKAGYVLAVLAIAASALLRWLMPEVLSRAPYLGFYPAVVAAAALGGVGPGLVATFGSLVFVNLVFVQFNLSDYGLQMRNLVWVVGSTGVSLLAGRLLDARRQAEAEARAARQSRALLQEMEQLTRAGGWEYDAVGKRITWTDEVYRIHGVTPETYDPNQLEQSLNFYPPKDRAILTEAFERAVNAGTPYDLELNFVKATGEQIWVRTSARPEMQAGRVVRVLGYIMDITERKRSAEALRERDERFTTLIENLHSGVALGDESGKFVIYNSSFLKLFGLSSEVGNINDQDWSRWQVFNEDGKLLDLDDHPVRKAALTGQPVKDRLVRVKRPFDGSDVWLLVSAEPILKPDGQLRLLICTYYDVTERKQAEEALRESEERFRVVQELSPDGFLIFRPLRDNTGDVTDFLWIYENEAATRMNDTNPQDVCGKRVSEVMPHHSESPFGKAYKEVAETGEVRIIEEGFYDQDTFRQRRWFRVVAVPTAGGDVAILVQDITERKRIESDIAAHRDLLETVFEHMPAAINIIRGRDLRLMMVNAGYRAIAPGKTEFVGKTLDELWPETGQDFAALCRRVLETGEPHHVVDELNMIRRQPDGPLEKAWFTWSLYRIRLPGDDGWGIFNPAWETTARKQAEEALRTSEERLRLAQQVARIGSFEFYPQTNTSHWSPELESLYGLAPGGYRGGYEGWAACVHPDDLPQAEQSLREAMVTGSFEAEWRVVRPDGTIRWLAGRGQVFQDDAGKPVRMVGVNLDITGSKEAEAAIRDSLREKEVLLKEIHHRVKNNLQVIASLVDMQTSALGNPALGAPFRDVRDRVRTMAMVHEKLYQSESLARLDLAGYTSSLVGYLARAHGTSETSVELKWDLEPAWLSVEKAVPFGLILNELVTNAFKHAFKGRATGEVTTGLRAGPNGQVCLWVRDDGVGLPAGLDWQKSPSLGLQLIEMLAGQLKAAVEVRREGGTEFKLTFGSESPKKEK